MNKNLLFICCEVPGFYSMQNEEEIGTLGYTPFTQSRI